MKNNQKYMTIFNMRFELRIIGMKNIQNYTDIEVVLLYNENFGRNTNFVGIDRDGELIDCNVLIN